MTGVFLSYRRDDAANDARRIYDQLVAKFGDELVYIDVEDIPLGVDFIEHITAALKSAAYVLVAIGPRWLLLTDESGRRRLDDPEDPVRFEIDTALRQQCLIVPMTVSGAKMPKARDLPAELAPLVRHNGIAIRPDPDFESDVAALMSGLHLDRIDRKRLPSEFSVGLVARNLGVGGSVGWGILGLIVGALSLQRHGLDALVGLTVAGILAGLIGGNLVGWLTGLLVRHRAPPLVATKVRRMGVAWSLGLAGAVVLAGVAGFFLAQRAVENLATGAAPADFSELIGSLIAIFLGGIIVFGLVMVGVIIVGFVAGTGFAAAYFARQLRLRSDQISRKRGVVIALAWLFGGLITGVIFIGLCAQVLALL